MKKLLPVMILLMVAVAMTAQSNLPRKMQMKFTEKENAKQKALMAPADIPGAVTTLPTPVTPSEEEVSYRSGEPYSIELGSSYNIYSVISGSPNSLNYDPVLNALVFCHRQNDGEDGGSGVISFDVSTDGGATWDASNKPVTPNLATPEGTVINGNRYPSGAIYNPPGNTDIANAKFVGIGSALWTHPEYGDNGWGWEFVTTANLDGSNSTEDYYTTAQDSASFLPYSLTSNPDGTLWYTDIKRQSRPGATTFADQFWNPVMTTQLTFDGDSYTRTVNELYIDYEGARDSFAFNPRLAFSPDGQTGYAVITGIEAGDTEAYPSVKPLIWKSTDAGATWEKQATAPYQAMDSLLAWTIPVDGDGDGAADSLAQGSPQVPYMSQFDITVDANGMLHIVASMLSSSDTSASQFGFVWIGDFATEIFHFMTDGVDWDTRRVGGYYNTDGAIGGATGAIDERMQASRSADGQYVYFTYAQTYYADDAEERPNSNPDIYGYAYRLSDGKTIEEKNFGVIPGFVWEDFEFTDAAFQSYLHMTSPVAISDGENWDHELPMVYGVPTDLNNELVAINYWYFYGAGFDESEFDGVIKTEDPVVNTSSIKVFPNPASNHVWVNFELLEDTQVAIDLFDLTGRTVASAGTAEYVAGIHNKNIALDNLASGTYMVRLQTASQVVTSKVVVK
jgi:hypothetical protein